jgi:hypothetical protein
MTAYPEVHKINVTISSWEQSTRDIFGALTFTDFHEYNTAAIVAKVFIVNASSSLSVDQVNVMAGVLFGLTNVDLLPTLIRLRKLKVLRTRMARGQKLYEVNY